MQKQTELDMTLNPTWKEMFVKPSYRKRVVMGTLFAFIGQSTAILVVNNYVSLVRHSCTLLSCDRALHYTKLSASARATNSSSNVAG